MTFADFCIYLLGCYLLYYFTLLIWDSVFNAKKTEKPDEIQLDLSGSQSPIIDIDKETQVINESAHLTSHDSEKKCDDGKDRH